ncbi:uracil-DNA glycosylase [Parvularcula sp. IMCC14364]|uniref:uracil-DNA glycosylase n=1 Tax=Parvularcula sp. IMCC14364 TaxID=3067902 RepID=UPI002740C041|nr:uracil-DNA glycosylase [Parvularcula sp. IMCC14364]
MTEAHPDEALRATLRWYADMGLDDVIGASPSDFSTWQNRGPVSAPQMQRKAPAPPSTMTNMSATQRPSNNARQTPAPVSGLDAPLPTDEAVARAQALAGGCESLAALRSAIQGFDGCPLKPGARNTVIDDGIEGAPLMVLGEAPGRDEDRIGKPFVGRAGQLLDRMLAAIGHSRFEDEMEAAYISNSIFWRPPGNRTPTRAEVAICLPFVLRLIELAQPKVLILVGNTPTQALFDSVPGITRARGLWRAHETSAGQVIPALPMFHPAFLLRQPLQKRLAWADLIEVRKKLKDA